MSEQQVDEEFIKNLPEAEIQIRQELSLVWLVPLVALLIGIWLAYKSWSTLGPEIAISFNTAEGLTAGKTKIKYKNVEIGTVKLIKLSDDLNRVVVLASLVKDAEKYLTEETRFWVVRARVAAGEVSGLGTLLSGVYIGIDPGRAGASSRNFIGLETPPVLTETIPGRHFVLRANDLGSLDLGSPVYYRKIKVGQIVSRNLQQSGQSVIIKVFINAPYAQRVNENTHFWNASGMDFSLDANGIQITTESLVTLIVGGIAFDTPVTMDVAAPANDEDEFVLYENRRAIFKKDYGRKIRYVLYFNQSVRGLNVGAPVEFRGIRLGEVTNVRMEVDENLSDVKIPITIALEPARFGIKGSLDEANIVFETRKNALDNFVRRGLRAELKTGNYVTGSLFVGLDFDPNAQPARINWETSPPEFPTKGTSFEEIANSVENILHKLEKLPLENISTQVLQSIELLNETMKESEQLVQSMNNTVAPAMVNTLEQTQKTLLAVENTIDSGSPVQHGFKDVLEELTKAARSIRVMADYLERHPDALIYGKEGRN